MSQILPSNSPGPDLRAAETERGPSRKAEVWSYVADRIRNWVMARRAFPERELNRLAWILAMACFLLLTWPLWRGRVPVVLDFGAFHLPLRDFYSRCLAAGESFDWMPGAHGGCFITGEGEAGYYHPWHLLLYRCLRVDRAFAIEYAANFVMMFAGMIVFLRARTGWAAALLGATLYTFSTNIVYHGSHPNMIAVLAHLPWILRLMEVGFTSRSAARRWYAWLGIALLTGSQVLQGHPQGMSYSLLVEACYAVWLLWNCSSRTVRSAAFLGVKLLGLIIGAVQLWATFAFFGESSRSQWDSMAGSLFPPALMQLVAPYLHARGLPELSTEWVYLGMAPVLLAAFWVATSFRQAPQGSPFAVDTTAHRDPRLGWFTLLLIGLATWLAIGSYGGLYQLQTLLPVVGKFRAPQRYLNLVDFGLALLAALAFQQLVDLVRHREKIAWKYLCLPWACVAATIVYAASLRDVLAPLASTVTLVQSLKLAPLLMILAGAGVTLAARGRVAGLYLLLILAAGDLAAHGLGIAVETSWDMTVRFKKWKADTSLPPVPHSGRILSDAWQCQKLIHADEMLINGYGGGLEPLKRLNYRDPKTLRLAGVAWYQHGFGNWDKNQVYGGTPTESFGWFRLPDPMPRARLVCNTQVSESPKADFSDLDIDTTAFVTHPVDLPSGTPGSVKLISDRPGRMIVSTNASSRQLLVLTEGYSQGWQARVNGRVLPTERVNADFLGCIVEPGPQQIEFVFAPVSVTCGRWISLLGVGIVMAFAGIGVRRFRPLETLWNRSRQRRLLAYRELSANPSPEIADHPAGSFEAPVYVPTSELTGDLAGETAAERDAIHFNAAVPPAPATDGADFESSVAA